MAKKMQQDNKIPARNATHSDADGKNAVVETYAQDMAKVIENGQNGLIKKIIHEDEEHEIEKINLSPQSSKNKFFVIMSFVFILFGFAILLYFFSQEESPTVPIAEQFVPLIFNDKSNFIEIKGLKKEEIAQTFFNAVNKTEVKSGGVEGMYPIYNKKIIGLREFFGLIKSALVLDASPLLVNDNFLMGAVNTEGKPASAETSASKDFFILIKVRSLPDIFDSLRAWEGKMFTDMHGFFGVALTPETKYLLTKEFQDGIVENKNARILYDNDPSSASGQANKIVMMYIFIDDSSVVITNTENAVREIMLRLASSQIKK